MLDIMKNITKRNRTTMLLKKNKYIVIHYVGAVSSAYNNTVYFKSEYRGASAHYFVDDNSIWQCVEDKDRAWHCGDNLKKGAGGKYNGICTNSNSIGIEMCCFKNGNVLDISEKTIKNTIDLTKYLMSKYNIPVDNVIMHYDVTNKTCPEPFVVNRNRWIDFKNRLITSSNGFNVGDRVFVHVPIAVAMNGEPGFSLVDSNGYQFWVHSSVIRNQREIYGWGEIVTVYNDELYRVKIFDKEFDCKKEYLGKKEF